MSESINEITSELKALEASFPETTHTDIPQTPAGKGELAGWLVCLEPEQLYVDWALYMGRNLIGSAHYCQITLPFAEVVSDIHTVIRCTPQQCTFRDCSSQYGSLVNEVPQQYTLLLDGDTLSLGGILFRFHLSPAVWRQQQISS